MHKDELPEEFSTLDELWAFWDTHSSADYEDFMEMVEAEVDLSSSKVKRFLLRDRPARVR